MSKTVLIVFGTRPEAIKMASLIHQLSADPRFKVKICVTAQHRQMLDQMLDLFDLKPDYDLDIMTAQQDLYEITSKVLLGMRAVLQEVKPDMVLVQGDTTTTMAASLAAFYQRIPCGHVEAGLRTWDLYAPYPEEANRSLVSSIAALHFAPTTVSQQNLLKQNIAEETIYVTGNTVIDSLLWVKERLVMQPHWQKLYGSAVDVLVHDYPFILVTGHRRENFGPGFLSICEALKNIATQYPAWHIVYPVHLNPNVQQPVYDLLSDYNNIHLIEPLDYGPFVYLLNKSSIVLTDSGGVQEEAPALGKPVLVMREKTERPEAIAAGTAMLVGADVDRIVSGVNHLINDSELYKRMATARNPYGDGQAAVKIKNILVKYFGLVHEFAVEDKCLEMA